MKIEDPSSCVQAEIENRLLAMVARDEPKAIHFSPLSSRRVRILFELLSLRLQTWLTKYSGRECRLKIQARAARGAAFPEMVAANLDCAQITVKVYATILSLLVPFEFLEGVTPRGPKISRGRHSYGCWYIHQLINDFRFNYPGANPQVTFVCPDNGVEIIEGHLLENYAKTRLIIDGFSGLYLNAQLGQESFHAAAFLGVPMVSRIVGQSKTVAPTNYRILKEFLQL